MNRNQIANKCAKHALMRIEQSIHLIQTLISLEGVELSKKDGIRFEHILTGYERSKQEEAKQAESALAAMRAAESETEESEMSEDEQAIP